jgi:RHS repeat-associated protein
MGDALGSVRQLVDGSGNVVLAKDYEPYGEVMNSAGTASTPYGFTNEYTSQGLIYLRARYYNPSIARFMTKASWGGNISQPLSYNAWLYVNSNPINYTDPSGHICLDPWAPSGVHFDPNRGCDYPEGSTGTFWWRRDPLGPDTAIIDMPWIDEQSLEMWNRYPNSCGAAALYMYLEGEGVSVNYDSLIDQLRSERPGGYDGYCCSNGWNGVFPTPTPDPLNWCNKACVSAKALGDVARKYYGLNIYSGDNWTHQSVYEAVRAGHPVLTLIRSEISASPNHFGHFVVIRGFVDRGWTVIFNDSYPGEAYWSRSAEQRRQAGEGREADWDDFDASWASSIDPMDPLAPGGHIRWAMTVR